MPFEYDESETIKNPNGPGYINQMKSGRQMVPRFEGEKATYDTLEEADSMAAKRSQYEYDELRRDPANQWYMPNTPAPPLLKNPGPSMHTPELPKERSMMNPLDTIKAGLQALDLNKMQTEGFDVNAHHERLLTTGPFADATKRQSVWDNPKEETPTNINVDDAANELRQQTSGSTQTGIDENLGMAELHQARQRHSELTMGTVFGGATGNWGANQNSPILMQPQPRAPIQPVQE